MSTTREHSTIKLRMRSFDKAVGKEMTVKRALLYIQLRLSDQELQSGTVLFTL